MSSSYTRTQIMNFLATNFPSEKVVDLSAESEEISDLLEDRGVSLREPWIGVQFLGNGESPVSISSNNLKGKFRELGAVILHIVEPSKLGVINAILPRAEALMDSFRGQRIGDVVVEDLVPLNTSAGAVLTFQRGYTSGNIVVNYYRDRDL